MEVVAHVVDEELEDVRRVLLEIRPLFDEGALQIGRDREDLVLEKGVCVCVCVCVVG